MRMWPFVCVRLVCGRRCKAGQTRQEEDQPRGQSENVEVVIDARIDIEPEGRNGVQAQLGSSKTLGPRDFRVFGLAGEALQISSLVCSNCAHRKNDPENHRSAQESRYKENSSHSYAGVLRWPGRQDILFLDSWKPMEFLLASPSLESAQNFKNRLAGGITKTGMCHSRSTVVQHVRTPFLMTYAIDVSHGTAQRHKLQQWLS